MRLLTTNFLTCAVKACKTSPNSFPLHFRDAELEQIDLPLNALFLRNVMPRLDWPALVTVCNELGLTTFPAEKPDLSESTGAMELDQAGGKGEDSPSQPTKGGDSPAVQQLWKILMQTEIVSGKLVCANCEHQYAIKEGIANFLLPAHLGKLQCNCT